MKIIWKFLGILVILLAVVIGVVLIKVWFIPDYFHINSLTQNINIGWILNLQDSHDWGSEWGDQSIKGIILTKLEEVKHKIGISSNNLGINSELENSNVWDLLAKFKDILGQIWFSSDGWNNHSDGEVIWYGVVYHDGYTWDENDDFINRSDEMLYWDSYKDDPELSIVMKAMWLRSTACTRIFCQSVADDWTYNNQKHYYWDKEKWKMILIPDVYYVSRNDCAHYETIYWNSKYPRP
jgi:hypothetical protein